MARLRKVTLARLRTTIRRGASAAKRLVPGDARSWTLEDRVMLSATNPSYLQLPLSFVPNQGQVASSAQYVAQGQGYALALTSGNAVLNLGNGAAASAEPSATGDLQSQTSNVVSMSLVGGSGAGGVQGLDELPGKVNYFLGPDPAQWHANVSTYGQVRYNNVYPSIDLVYYGNQGQLEYDFIVNPGANSNEIQLHYDGVTSSQIDSAGNLVLATSGGNVVLQKPTLYQMTNGARQTVQGAFVVGPDGDVKFSVGAYDASKPLVIDPVLVYSTYFGGSSDDQNLAVAVDPSGAAYITGSTLSTDLATTPDALTSTSSVADIFKTTNAGASWQGAGSGVPDADFSSIVVDPKNPNTIYAATFDDRQAPQGIFKSTDGGNSWNQIDNGLSSPDVSNLIIDPVHTSTLYASAGAFVFKTTDGGAHWNLSNNGIPTTVSVRGMAISPSNPSIVYATVSGRAVYKTTDGGADWAQAGGSFLQPLTAVVIDPTNPSIIYVGSDMDFFDSTPGGVFKSTDGGASYQFTNLQSSSGAFEITKLAIDSQNPQTVYASGTQFSSPTLYKSKNGGVSWDSLSPGIETNGEINQLAVGGGTPSRVYLTTSSQGVLESTDGGNTFVSANLAVPFVYQVGINPTNPNTIYAATNGRPRTIFGTIDTDAFVAKLTPDGKSFAYITYLGGVGNDVGRGIAVDAEGDAFIGGITTAGAFPTTAGAVQATTSRAAGDSMGFVTKLNPTGSALIYSTYLGGTNTILNGIGDEVHALVLNGQGQAVVAGQTSAGNFPTTSNAFQPGIGFGEAAFVSVLAADGRSLVYSTYLGGASNQEDSGNGVALDSHGNIYVTGSAGSEDPRQNGPISFPVTPSAYQSNVSKIPGAFFSEFDPTASGDASLLYSTVIDGTDGAAIGNGIAVDAAGHAYITGSTNSSNFPTRNGYQTTYGGDDHQFASDQIGDAFVSEFDPALSGAASLLYSTYLGGAQSDVGYAVAIDGQGHAVVTGTTFSGTFPTFNSIEQNPGGQVAYLTALDTSATGSSSLVYSTILGGSNDHAEGHGLAVDNKGQLYVVGFTSAADFETMNPAVGAQAGGSDGFVVKVSPATGQADLNVNVTAKPDPVTQGQNVTYTITITNNGPDAVGGVYVSDKLDTGTTFVSATPPPSSQGNGELGFALGSLANRAAVQIQLTVRVDTPSLTTLNGSGQSVNTVTVLGDRPDPAPANNQFVYTATVTQRSADVGLVVKPVPGPILVGQDFVYQFVVTNHGPDDSQGTVLTETLPPNATFVSATPAATTAVNNVLTFNLGSIKSGQSATVLIRMTPLAGAGDFIFNSSSITSTSLDTNTANNTSQFQTVVTTPDTSDLSVALDGPAFSVSFTGLTYTATITNNGPHAADHVIFTGDVTALASITSTAASQGTASRSGNVITANLGTIAVGQSATVTFVVDSPSSDLSITVDGSVAADERDPDHSNDKPTLRTKVGEGAITFVVTNTNGSGPGSLRQAITDSEAQQSTVDTPNHIVFDIPESDPNKDPITGAFVISPLSALPAIFTPTILDGYTQPGASANSNPIDQPDNARIRIELDGSQAGRPANGLTVFAFDTTIRGLAINRFVTKLQRGTTQNLLFDGVGIDLYGDNDIVEGDFIGTDASGTVAHGNEVAGVLLWGNFQTVGGTTPDARNVISANGADGVGTASTTGHNVVIGNFIGLDVSGARALRTNLLNVGGLALENNGVVLEGLEATVGGTTPEDRNILSGNVDGGLEFFNAPSGNLVFGNYIGTDISGSKAVPNGGNGVSDEVGTVNTIGGTAPGQRNLISGNNGWGAQFKDAGNILAGNYIGTDVTGLLPLGNGLGGVNATNTTDTITSNLISANNGPGVSSSADGLQVNSNQIGLDANGNPLGNAGDGVQITSSSNGGNGAANGQGDDISGNTIAFNLGNGISVTTTDSSFGGGTGNSFSGNSLFQNGGLGIDLGDDGVTSNHAALTTAAGPNHFQNYPTLTSAVSDGTTTTIQGSLAGLANRGDVIDFYASPFLDPTGFGEGKTWLGSINLTTDASGNGGFTAPFAQDLGGQYITATATTGNPGGISSFGSDTSEFSQGILVTGAQPTPPPTTSADLKIAGSVLTANPVVGGTLTYQFTITNLGTDPALVVVFNHVLPAGVILISASATAGAATFNNGAVTCNLGTLDPNDSQTITIVVTPTVAGALSGSAAVSATTTDPNAGNNSASLQTTIGPGSLGTDVSISMVGSADTITVGGTLLYTMNITNNGPRVATGIVLQQTLPAGMTFMPDDSSPGLSVIGNQLAVPVGALALGDSVKAFVTVQAIAAGSMTSTSSTTLTQTDTVPENNSASVSTTVLKSPSVTVLATAASPTNPGDMANFTVTVYSPTVGTPTGTIVFSEGSTVLKSTQLDSSGSAAFQTSSLSPGMHTIVATYVGDSTFNSSSMSVVQTVTGAAANSADLNLGVQASPGTVVVGSHLTYTVSITNNGPSAASNVVVAAHLPSSTLAGFFSATASQGTESQANGVVTASLNGLAAGASATVTIVVTPTAAGNVGLSASVAATESDPNTNNNTASASATAVTATKAPITLDRTIDLVYGTIRVAAGLGFPTEDAASLSSSLPTNVIDAILNQPGLDSRAGAALRAIRGAGGTATDLGFFNATTNSVQSTFGGTLLGPPPSPDAEFAVGLIYQTYFQNVTLGAGKLTNAAPAQSTPLVLEFPGLVPASSGQSVNGRLTVRLIEQDATITGPIGTTTALSASANHTLPGAPITFTASVSGNGEASPAAAGGSSNSVSFIDGSTLLGTAPLDASGKATLSVSTLSSGRHMISAVYGGTSLFAASRSSALSQVVGSLESPSVTSVQRFGYHHRPTTLVVHFNEALDPASALNPANYEIVSPGRDGRLGTRDDGQIPIGAIEYDPVDFIVDLQPVSRISLWHPYHLIVRGEESGGGLKSIEGIALAGKGPGQPATDFMTTLTHATWVEPIRTGSKGAHARSAGRVAPVSHLTAHVRLKAPKTPTSHASAGKAVPRRPVPPAVSLSARRHPAHTAD